MEGFQTLVEEKILEHHDCDWVIKADDDTFVIVENLRKSLKSYDPHQLVAFGLPLMTWDSVINITQCLYRMSQYSLFS